MLPFVDFSESLELICRSINKKKNSDACVTFPYKSIKKNKDLKVG